MKCCVADADRLEFSYSLTRVAFGSHVARRRLTMALMFRCPVRLDNGSFCTMTTGYYLDQGGTLVKLQPLNHQ